MNNRRDNDLNFDFDSPIENFFVESPDSGEEVFDLAAYAASGEKKNSRAKRNRLHEEIELDKTIAAEQNRFHSNKEKHSAQNAETRTAPHAITADELMRGRRQRQNTAPTPVSVYDEIKATTPEASAPSTAENSSSDDNGYSSAAQLVFQKMRDRKPSEPIREAKTEPEEIEEEIKVENADFNEIGLNDIENNKPAEEVGFRYENKEKINYESVKYVFNHDEITDSEPESKTSEDEMDFAPITEEASYNEYEDDNEQEDDSVNYFEPEQAQNDSEDDIYVQPLYMADDLKANGESEAEDYVEYDYQGEESANFDNEYEQDSFELNDDSDEYDDFSDDFMNDLPPIGNDAYDFDEEIDEYEEYEQGEEELYEGEEAEFDDVGFDLLGSADELFEDDVTVAAPVVQNGNFDGLDEELLDDISPYKEKKGFFAKIANDNVEYHNIDDEYNVRFNLNKRKNFNLIKFAVSLVGAVVSLILTSGITPVEVFSPLFWIIIGVFNIITLVVNYDSLKAFNYIIDGDFEIELLPSMAGIASLVQAILGIFRITVFEGVFVFSIITSAVFAFTALANYIRVNDIIKNFNLICTEDDKNIVTFVEQPDSNKVMDAEDGIGYRIAMRKKVKDVQGFMDYSTSSGPYEGLAQKITIATIVLSVIMAVLFVISAKAYTFSIGYTVACAVAGLCGALCIATPVSSLILSVIAVRRVNSVLKRYNAVLPGYLSGKDIDNINVVCADITDLFGEDDVKLYNIKTFGGLALDKAIIDASALLTAANSPMQYMFSDFSAVEAVPETDSIAYEEKMGLSGWVGGRKTLIGNRMIMETHGISVPPIEVDKKIIRNGYFPVYLASEGQLSALFIVGYNANSNVSYCLKQMYNSGLTLLVKTCDPNITDEMIADYFGIHRDSVKIMSRESEIVMKKSYTSDSASLICDDTYGYFNGVLSSIKLCKYSWYSAVAQIIIIALAFLIFGIAVATGSFGFLNIISLIVYNIISILVIYIFHTKYI